MKISEIFYSLQGEGFLAGVPSVFVRLAGCPLRCGWCDTKYAWDRRAGTDCTAGEIASRVEELGARHVVITGGEPVIDAGLPELSRAVGGPARHVTIETAGIEFVPRLACDLMSISPKLRNSVPADPQDAAVHEGLRLNTDALRGLTTSYEYQLKFVVASRDDLSEVREVLEALPDVDPGRVMLMPQAADRAQYLAKAPMVAQLCKESGFVFSPRLQMMLWDGGN
jgi:7-carboxy-7-deazaguanine synthase